MLRRTKYGIALIASIAQIAWGALDLTPRYVAIQMGEVMVHRVRFRDGDKHFGVTINADVEILGAANSAIFRFKTIAMAEMSLRQSKLKPATPFSPEALPDYQRIAREQLGATAEIVAETPPEFDVLPTNGWKSCRFNFTTKQPGFTFKTDVTFLNLNSEQQIIIVTTSKETDFADVQGRARKIMSRWHEVLPGDELGLN